MSLYKDIKSDFRHSLVLQGWRNLSKAQTHFPNIPEHIFKRWWKQFWAVRGYEHNGVRSLINHFTLGADPEFLFLDADDRRVHAAVLGLHQGVAFGQDNSGRQAEIRPCPSRSALEVVASITATLYWMTRFVPDTPKLTWRGGAYLPLDGLGGHIHFGRKRNTTADEIRALDTLTWTLYQAQVFDLPEGRSRIENTRYGHPSDMRQQLYGYEYRTLPCWLDSPWLAFFVLTLAKLAVLQPAFWPLVQRGDAEMSDTDAVMRLARVLAYFQCVDDDAALAYEIFQRRGIPHADSSNFSLRWGISPLLGDTPKRVKHILPVRIPVTKEHCVELAHALLEIRPPILKFAGPTWQPATLPEGYKQLLDASISTVHAPGFGELLVNLCTHKSCLVEMFWGDDNRSLGIVGKLSPRLNAAIPKLNRMLAPLGLCCRQHNSESLQRRGACVAIGLPPRPLAENEFRRQLYNCLVTCLPLWPINSVTSDSYLHWQQQPESVLLSKHKYGKIVYPCGGDI